MYEEGCCIGRGKKEKEFNGAPHKRYNKMSEWISGIEIGRDEENGYTCF